MRFSKIVKTKNIFSGLQSGDRNSALREMVGRLKENGEIPEEAVDPILDDVLSRERLGTTGIGKGIAIPHVRSETLDGILVGIGQSDDGVDFASVDGEMVKVIFLILAPEAKQDDYLAVLRWVSSMGRDEYNNKLLLGARTQKDFAELFQDIEESA